MSKLDPEEAHRDEILEAMLSSSLKADSSDFEAFREEWDRIEVEPKNGREAILKFHGKPRIERLSLHCEHCHSHFSVQATVFMPFPGLPVAVHMASCPAAADCHCWSRTRTKDDSMFAEPLCQKCERRATLCECLDGPHYGPCTIFEREERDADL